MSETAGNGADAAAEVAATYLLSAQAVRERSAAIAALVADGRSDHFTLHRDRMPEAAGRVTALIRRRFPDLSVPLHSRWRHVEAGNVDRWGQLAAARGFDGPAEEARAAADLAIVSVLLDAGAGADWSYGEAATGMTFARSEGLAVASLAMFASGVFSSVPADPLRCDAEALATLGADEFARGFQAGPDNPLLGMEGRRALLVALAWALRDRPDIFAVADDPRPGGIVDYLAAKAADGRLPAPAILEAVLEGLGPIWPGRLELAGRPLGDAWRHPALGAGSDAPGADIVPFHKLSQWLSWSLVEPLSLVGVTVTDLDGLTGLAEYRNGGLFLDAGVIALKNPSDAEAEHAVDSPLVVEWRALTVTLLDETAAAVRADLGLDAEALPLGSVLEGGTWLAGREIAREKRPDGGPPLKVASDGTVF